MAIFDRSINYKRRTVNKAELAHLAVTKMLSGDEASRRLGMKLQSVSPGGATLTMSIGKEMVNGHNIVHGGIVFSLADTAFACACNSHNIVNVAQTCTINCTRPALLGDVLSATAVEVTRGRRSGVYDVRVENADGKLVALFRGLCANLNKPVVEI